MQKICYTDTKPYRKGIIDYADHHDRRGWPGHPGRRAHPPVRGGLPHPRQHHLEPAQYADPAQDISVRFVKENGKAGLAFENAVLPGQHRTDSTKVGLTSIETMMEKMHAACRIEQSGERFCITLLFPIALSVTPQA